MLFVFHANCLKFKTVKYFNPFLLKYSRTKRAARIIYNFFYNKYKCLKLTEHQCLLCMHNIFQNKFCDIISKLCDICLIHGSH